MSAKTLLHASAVLCEYTRDRGGPGCTYRAFCGERTHASCAQKLKTTCYTVCIKNVDKTRTQTHTHTQRNTHTRFDRSFTPTCVRDLLSCPSVCTIRQHPCLTQRKMYPKRSQTQMHRDFGCETCRSSQHKNNRKHTLV